MTNTVRIVASERNTARYACSCNALNASSGPGPEEAFNALHEHAYLAVFLSLATILTVFVISKLLGRPVGVVSGCALLVDYVLTITVSIAAAGDALFGLLGGHLHHLK